MKDFLYCYISITKSIIIVFIVVVITIIMLFLLIISIIVNGCVYCILDILLGFLSVLFNLFFVIIILGEDYYYFYCIYKNMCLRLFGR